MIGHNYLDGFARRELGKVRKWLRSVFRNVGIAAKFLTSPTSLCCITSSIAANQLFVLLVAFAVKITISVAVPAPVVDLFTAQVGA